MAKKRFHNEGSICKRNNGTWRAQVCLDGGRLSFTGKTQKECKDWIKKTLDQVESGLTYDNAQITLNKFMQDWLVSIEASVRVATHRQYTQITNQHILPFIGKHKLNDLKPEFIQ